MRDKRSCDICMKTFVALADWQHKCIVCWKKGANYDITKSDLAFAEMQDVVEEMKIEHSRMLETKEQHLRDKDKEVEDLASRLQQEQEKCAKALKSHRKLRLALEAQKTADKGIDEEMTKKLIRLVHPDKHNNSELSNEVTKWLLSLRKTGEKS